MRFEKQDILLAVLFFGGALLMQVLGIWVGPQELFWQIVMAVVMNVCLYVLAGSISFLLSLVAVLCIAIVPLVAGQTMPPQLFWVMLGGNAALVLTYRLKKYIPPIFMLPGAALAKWVVISYLAKTVSVPLITEPVLKDAVLTMFAWPQLVAGLIAMIFAGLIGWRLDNAYIQRKEIARVSAKLERKNRYKKPELQTVSNAKSATAAQSKPAVESRPVPKNKSKKKKKKK